MRGEKYHEIQGACVGHAAHQVSHSQMLENCLIFKNARTSISISQNLHLYVNLWTP